MRLLLFLVLTVFSTHSYGQIEGNVSYERTWKAINEELLTFRITGIMDTTVAFISGLVVDDKGQGAPSFELIVRSKEDSLHIQSDSSNGAFSFYLLPGEYDFEFTGHGKLIIRNVLILPGQKRKIVVSLGSVRKTEHIIIEKRISN